MTLSPPIPSTSANLAEDSFNPDNPSASTQLLTDAQKRQNVDSEKRRRAAIKTAFEDLQVLVPALAQAASEAKAAGSSAGSKRQREPSADDELAAGQDAEKPGAVNIKSEAHILQHTVAYIETLSKEREELEQRISYMRTQRGHPS